MSKITLISEDEVSLTLSREAAKQSGLLRQLLQDEEETTEVRVEANSIALGKVVEWCQQCVQEPLPEHLQITEWERKFHQIDQEVLYEIILASHLLEISRLLEAGCKTVANMIKGKSPKEIRKTFNIQNDFTPEEEEKIRREIRWAEDKEEEQTGRETGWAEDEEEEQTGRETGWAEDKEEKQMRRKTV
ncbi:MAG: hypothetical protein LQ342_005199 [Letrouitia transgressa]|nr:MAG: hypothetical protein LQ342_005199 [Letrouitia transgressa]